MLFRVTLIHSASISSLISGNKVISLRFQVGEWGHMLSTKIFFIFRAWRWTTL